MAQGQNTDLSSHSLSLRFDKSLPACFNNWIDELDSSRDIHAMLMTKCGKRMERSRSGVAHTKQLISNSVRTSSLSNLQASVLIGTMSLPHRLRPRHLS